MTVEKQTPPATRSSLRLGRKSLALLVIVVVLAWLTNPDVTRHKQLTSGKINEKLEQLRAKINPEKKILNVLKDIGFALSSGLVQKQIDERIWADDYYLYSLTKVRLKNKSVTVGFGAFGNVWLFTDVIDGVNPEDLIK